MKITEKQVRKIIREEIARTQKGEKKTKPSLKEIFSLTKKDK